MSAPAASAAAAAEGPALPVAAGRRRRLPAILAPLAGRDFALLWLGRATSLLGDGVYPVALAFQVYALSNTPAALSIVGLALSVPQVLLFVVGGVLTDRLDARRVLIAADLVRGTAVGAIGVLAVTGALELWHVVILVIAVGAGDALFNPAFTTIVPALVPQERLVQANALEQLVRPLALRLIGPGLGGIAVAAAGAGQAFLFDATTFLVSAAAVAAVRLRPSVAATRPRRSVGADVREGLAYVARRRWLWGVLAAGAVSLLCFWGPFEVLLPYVVKNRLGGTAAVFGLVLAAGGVGAMGASLVLGQRGLPRHRYPVMLGAWTVMTGSIAAYGLVTATWQAMAVYAVAFGLNAVAMTIWSTILQTLVPHELLGRVSSIDWALSFALIPLSFALTGPIAAVAGTEATLVGAGVLGVAGALGVVFGARLHRLDV